MNGSISLTISNQYIKLSYGLINNPSVAKISKCPHLTICKLSIHALFLVKKSPCLASDRTIFLRLFGLLNYNVGFDRLTVSHITIGFVDLIQRVGFGKHFAWIDLPIQDRL